MDCLNRRLRQLWHMRWPQSSLGHLDTGTSSRHPLQSRLEAQFVRAYKEAAVEGTHSLAGRSGDVFRDESPNMLPTKLRGRREDDLDSLMT